MDFRWDGTRRSVNLSTCLLQSLKEEQWDLLGEDCSGAGVLQDMDSTLVLLLLGTVNGELKILQNRAQNRFLGKRTTIYRR